MKTFCIGIVLTGMLVSGARDCFGQTFSEVSIGPLQGTFEGQMVWLDVDHDLDYDLIICGNLSTKLFKNTGGVFSESIDHNLPGLSHPAIAMADFNHDGFADLVLTGNTSDDTSPVPMGNIFINDGTGIFTASSTANLLPLFFGSVDCSDFDRDGDEDILMTGYNANSVSQSVIYSNNGDGSFSLLSPALLPGVFHGTGMWGDFDNDGDPDILISGDNHTDNNPNKPLTKIFRNKGDRTFEEVATTITPIHGKSSWADVNEDGRLDLFTSGYASDGGYYSFLYLNQGGDSFVKSTGLPFEGTSFIDFRWADFDNDGDLDLLTSSAQGSEVSIYVNTAGVFALLAGTNFNHAEVLSVGDFDSDQDQDILLSGLDPVTSLPVTTVYRNDINSPNDAPAIPAGLTAEVLNSIGTKLTWTGSTDTETSSAALAYAIRLGTSPGGSQIMSPLITSDGFIFGLDSSVPSPAITITIRNLPSGTYYWSVQALDQSRRASGSPSEVSFTVTPSPPIPDPPSLLSVEYAPTDKINIAWSDLASNETGYEIERSITMRSPFIELNITVANTTSYIDIDDILFDGDSVFYRIAAMGLGGKSPYSNVLGTFVPIKGPTNLQISLVAAHVKLEWLDNSAKESGYQVERSLDDHAQFIQIKELTSNSTSYEDDDAPQGKNLFYRVRAKTTDLESEYSNEVTTLVTALPSHEIVAIFPNPAHDVVVVSNLNRSADRVQIINLQGIEVATGSCAGLDEARLSTKELAAGFYFIKIERADEVIVRRVIIK